MRPQTYIRGLIRKTGTTRKAGSKVPDLVRPLLRRLMTPGASRLDMVEWSLVRSYESTLKAKKKESP